MNIKKGKKKKYSLTCSTQLNFMYLLLHNFLLGANLLTFALETNLFASTCSKTVFVSTFVYIFTLCKPLLNLFCTLRIPFTLLFGFLILMSSNNHNIHWPSLWKRENVVMLV